MAQTSFDLIIVGGGIVGTATALALTQAHPGLKLAILEKEDALAAHQTGHNSGVIHSGLYYLPGSLKAKNCCEGREALYTFCAEQGINAERCGKVVVATRESELPALDELERRGHANGLVGLERLDAQGVKEHEPHVAGIAGLFVPQTGIVDYTDVTNAYARVVRAGGGEIRTSCRVTGVQRQGQDFRIATTQGELSCGMLINCAGLQSDRLARACGVDPGVQIIPFRGEYYLLAPEKQALVRNLVYPVPDPAFPFLGVHFTRMMRGGIEAGPNAVLALKREGYNRFSLSLADLFATLTYPGFRHLAKRFWKVGAMEYHRSFSKNRFLHDLQRLIPELQKSDIQRGGAGVRAQAVDPQGKLLDDFHIISAEGMIHVLNAPSPAATASLSIGRTIAGHAERLLSS